MKIKGSDYQALYNAIKAVYPKAQTRDQLLEMRPKIKDIDLAYRFNLFFESGFKVGDGIGIIGDINGDFNDENINSALKKIVNDIENTVN